MVNVRRPPQNVRLGSAARRFRRRLWSRLFRSLLVAALWWNSPGWLGTGHATTAEEEEPYYRLLTLPVPDDLKLEVSGLTLRPDGRLGVAIRKGEVWLLEGAHAEANSGALPTYRRFASGLHEPLGLVWHEGAFYLAQRTELTCLRDTNGDEVADEYLTVAKGWGVSGNYHEYAYGPVLDRHGHFWITLNSTIGEAVDRTDRTWRGWSLKIAPDGTWQPVSGGLRSPCGLGLNAAGDVFTTDQQGNWFGAGALIHLQPGVFHGHPEALEFCALPGATFRHPGKIPSGLTVDQVPGAVPGYQPPAVWFPYRKAGMSATDLLCDTTDGRFGPFTNQMFVGEFTMSQIHRVFLEVVEGAYQGACFPFRKGFQCGVFRLAWGQDGSLLAGQNNRGWNSLGTRSYGLQRLVWTGRTPFEIQEMRARPDGFELVFTAPVDAASAAEAAAMRLISYTYRYHGTYGSEEVNTRTLRIRSATVSADGLRLGLVVEGLRAGYVHELHLPGLRAQGDRRPLLHAEAFYTLNRIPQRL